MSRITLLFSLAVISTVLFCFNLGLYFFGDEVRLFYLNAKGGCYPWSPAVVEYHDGMTICPGQSARMTIPVVISGERKGGGI